MKATIDALHAAYCSATGQQIRLAYDRERAWYEFAQAGFTAEDVELVGRWLAGLVRKGDRNPGCLRFRNLIERVDLFEEELSLCRAAQRNFKPPVTERERVIKAFRPEVESVVHTPCAAKPAAAFVTAAVAKLREAAR